MIEKKLHIYIHICAHYAYILYIYTHTTLCIHTYIYIYIGYKYGLSQNMVHTSICNRKVAHHFSMCFLIEMAIKSTAYGIFGSVPAPILTIITLHIYIFIFIYTCLNATHICVDYKSCNYFDCEFGETRGLWQGFLDTRATEVVLLEMRPPTMW